MTTLSNRPKRALNITLWIIQALLAAVFIPAGVSKLMMPISQLVSQMAWVSAVPAFLVRFIGLAEIAGGLGLILPHLFRVRPRLTLLAALGLVVVMLLATVFHITRGETMMIPANLVLAAMAAFVAWGRRS